MPKSIKKVPIVFKLLLFWLLGISTGIISYASLSPLTKIIVVVILFMGFALFMNKWNKEEKNE